jgi:tetratricopeptide (TPR) repeat protein
VDEVLVLAEQAWRRIRGGEPAAAVFEVSAECIDVLWAIGRFIDMESEVGRLERLDAVERIYRFACSDQLADQTEKHAICGRLAYVAWTICRRAGWMAGLRDWESRCEMHATAQEALGEFLALSQREWSTELVQRFVTAPEVAVAILRRQRARTNQDPPSGYQFLETAFRWVQESGLFGGEEEKAYFLGELAWLAASALRHMGRFNDLGRWLPESKKWIERTACPGPSLAKVELVRVTATFDRHLPDEALRHIPKVRRDLERFELVELAVISRMLEALALYALDRREEALERLEQLRCDHTVKSDPLLLGIVLMNVGQIYGKRDGLAMASAVLAAAGRELDRAAVPWASAHCHAITAELLRDEGFYDAAIEAYERSVELHLSLEMESQAAYTRVLMAETMLLAGRDTEAQMQLVATLPILDRERLIRDAVAAVTLFRESIQRKQADPEAFRNLRLQIEKIRQGGQS